MLSFTYKNYLMKKITLILFFFVISTANSFAAGYLFSKNTYTDCDILTKKDTTTFQSLSYINKDKINFWDRRTAKSGGWNKSNFEVFVFKAIFDKNKDVTVRVNSEFKTKEKAEKQALKYAKMVGQTPNFLRTSLKTITIHKGNKSWGGGNFDILIHTSDEGAKGKCGEEVMLHELGHVSLDQTWGGLIKLNEWKNIAKLDSKYISKYAKDFPDREDIAETINWWVAVRCKQDTISKSNFKKILKNIPNRLKFLDEQKFDTYPLVCKNK